MRTAPAHSRKVELRGGPETSGIHGLGGGIPRFNCHSCCKKKTHLKIKRFHIHALLTPLTVCFRGGQWGWHAAGRCR